MMSMKLEPRIGSQPMPTQVDWPMNVVRHDADFAFARGDNAWAVRADHVHACFILLHLHGQHIKDAIGYRRRKKYKQK